MGFLSWALSIACTIVILVCFIMVLIQMFQRGQTGLGIACAVLAICGIGFLIAFIVGWINATTWGIKNVMLLWTVAFVVHAILQIGGFGPNFAQFR